MSSSEVTPFFYFFQPIIASPAVMGGAKGSRINAAVIHHLVKECKVLYMEITEGISLYKILITNDANFFFSFLFKA